jgi:hypothetical protein
MSASAANMQQLLSTTGSGIGSTLGNLNDILGIYGGVQSGSPLGYGMAASNAGKLAGSLTNNPQLSNAAGALGSGLGLYSGLEQGGVSGYGQAGVDALRLGSYGANLAGDSALSQGLGSAAGYAAIPLALYDFGSNWQSGATGSDALSGGEAGASIGSAFGPVGTAIGALGGAAVGALSSAFGGGKPDPETESDQALQSAYGTAYSQNPTEAQSDLSTLSPQQSFESLAGYFDAKNNSPGHSQPIEQTFGRTDEGPFLNDIANQINSDYASGAITPGESASQIYSSEIDPWITSQTGGQGILGPQSGEGGIISGDIQNLIGDYTNGSLTSTTPIGISGQEDTTLPAYAGLGATPSASSPLGVGMSTPSTGNVAASRQMVDRGAVTNASKGGIMKKRKSLPRYDDGGDVDDLDLFSDPGDLTDSNDLGLNLTPSGLFGNVTSPLDTGFNQAVNPNDPTTFYNASDFGPTTSGTGNGSGSGSGKGISGGLSSLLQGLGLSASTAGTLASLGLTAASLAPIIASLTGSKTAGSATQPSTTPPAGYAPPSTPFSVPSYSRSYTGPTTSSWTPQQWYTYGEGPEQSFFSNNQIPGGSAPLTGSTPAPVTTGPSPGSSPMQRARGGALSQVHQGPGYVNDPGYGDGTSDDVNANLSGGEYVMDGGTVSLLGNGSNEAGARKLDQLRQKVRQHAGKDLVKGKQFMEAKEPAAYLKGGK